MKITYETIENLYRSHPDGAAREPEVAKRHSKGQTWLARRLGLSVSTVRSWAEGRREPNGAAKRLLEQIGNEAGLLKGDDDETP